VSAILIVCVTRHWSRLAFCHIDGLAIVDRKPLNLFFRLRPQSRWRRLVDRIGDDPAIGFNRRKMEADRKAKPYRSAVLRAG